MPILLLCAVLALGSAARPPPNIVIFLVDDLGFNDVSFHGSTQIPTPNIDRLAREGTVLTRHYVQPICTPSRGALLTGQYPIRLGLQHDTVEAMMPYGLPPHFTALPQHLRGAGYSTHMVGKWHQGFFKKEYTPTYRGFETFFGFYGGSEDYWTHTEQFGEAYGLDFHDDVGTDLKPAWDYFGNYSTDIFADRAVKIIQSQHEDTPLFLYLPFQGVHAPLQGKSEDQKFFPQIWSDSRRYYATHVKAVDDGIGMIVHALETRGMLDDTIILFSSDNGGPHFPPGFLASNFPLRSCKTYLFEGGVRVLAFIRGPGVPRETTHDDYVHITDWLPTLLSAAGVGSSDLGEMDGVDQWASITNGTPGARSEILLNIDPVLEESGIIVGRYKLYRAHKGLHRVGGTVYDGWYHDGGPFNQTDTSRVTHQGSWKLPLVTCPKLVNTTACDMTAPGSLCLFDILSDPCEQSDLSAEQPQTVAKLTARLQQLRKEMVPVGNRPADPRSDPRYHGGVWMPWRE